MPRIRHVALLVEASRETGRGILRGVIRYSQQHDPWSIHYEPHGIEELPPRWLRDWKGDGILARINDRRTARLLLRCNVPVVDVRGATVVPQFPRFEIDNDRLAEMVASYLRDRGLRRLAFCAFARGVHRLFDERCDAFVRHAKRAGCDCEVFRPETRPAEGARSLSEAGERRMARWVGGLKAPIGILACNDDLGIRVLNACREAGRPVPDEIAVMGVENDPFLCNLSTPPLTSVDVDAERLGYEACAVLETLMRGGRAPACTRWPPARIVGRHSTDVLAIQDAEVARAIRHIRDHACLRMTVSDLTRRFPLSRSSLNRRFQEVLGRGPKQEIARVQMERACELLLNSDLSIQAVAQSCGFTDSNYFSRWFHARCGASPLRFRQRRAK